MASHFYSNSIFWIEVEKVKPNPYQPRREFDQARLQDLADSIRMYGVLQPLVVTRHEVTREDGGLTTEYELISGERRLRASKLAGLAQVPVLIRAEEENERVKLELAIIENLQREDLNPVDRARAFKRLAEEFHFKHNQIAEKVGKSREYVSNTMRLLSLPEEMLTAVSEGRLSEGHTRPLLMLIDRPDEQMTLYKEIIYKKMTVREAEAIARKIAYDKVRKKERAFDPELVELEEKLAESLGTRVHVERKDQGGRLVIDFFSNADLQSILDLVRSNKPKPATEMMEKYIAQNSPIKMDESEIAIAEANNPEGVDDLTIEQETSTPVDDRSSQEKQSDEEDLYSIKNFSI
ncbi:MAG TPA: ParB/RepB/Spo0J family partition protein [Candidatus Paceibacterota bacterium]|nr:ParB/RepB/Spo0J family partition protein [Candidatus Paceibacterota bacterium]